MNKELIAEIRNKLQRPHTALEKLSKGEDVPKEFIEGALKSLDEGVSLLAKPPMRTLTEEEALLVRGNWNPNKAFAPDGILLENLNNRTYLEVVDLFAKRINGWYFEVANHLRCNAIGGSNFTVTILCCVIIDLLSQYICGAESSKESIFKDFVREYFKEDNKELNPPIISCTYKKGVWVKVGKEKGRGI